MYDIFVPQEIVRDPRCSHKDVAIWCAVFMDTYSPYIYKTLVTSARIAYQLAEKNKQGVSESIDHLLELGYLKGVALNKKEYEITMDSFDRVFDKDVYHVKMNPEDMSQILCEKSRRYTVLRYYLLILSTVNYQCRYGYYSNQKLGEILQNDSMTISYCFKRLEDLHLLYIYRSMNFSNTYGRYADKDLVIAAGNKRTGGKQLKLSANRKRQMTQWYNQIKKGNPKYTQDQEIMRTVREYCEKDKSRYDMSVFT